MHRCVVEKRKLLERLGFSLDTWGEVVVVFFRDSDVVGLMPLGLRLSESCTLVGRLYKGSKLYNYILSTGVEELRCRVCVSGDPQLFYVAIFEKDRVAKAFEKSFCPKSLCCACLAGLCRFHCVEGEEIIGLELSVDEVAVRKAMPTVFTRASAALIEALVWLTKMPYMECEDVGKVLERIEFLREVVYRSSNRKLFQSLADKVFSKALDLVKSIESCRCGSGDKDI